MTYTKEDQDPKNTEDWSWKPRNIDPEKNSEPASDAQILYKTAVDTVNWEHENGEPVKWNAGEYLTVKPDTGDIQTKQKFGSVQLHIEWRSPEKIIGEGQGRGNSGVFLMGFYEVQILDSYQNETYYNGMAGSIYKQYTPQVNACLPPGEWQSFEILFTAPVFNEEHKLKRPAYITVLHNGVLIQNHVELKGPTRYRGKPEYTYHESKLPLRLQDHGDLVSFRNIWLREL